MEEYDRGVLQAVWDAVRLPFRHPAVLIQSSALFLLLDFANRIDMTLTEPWFYFSSRIEYGSAYLNWHFNVLYLASLIPLLNLVVGWFRISFGAHDTVRANEWWNIDRSSIRFALQCLGIFSLLIVLFLIGMLVAIPVAMLGELAGLAKLADAFVGTGFELLLYWVGFQLMLALVSTAVDKMPVGLFEAWVLNDGISIRCALAVWLVSKLNYCLQYALTWSTADTSVWYLTDALFHFDPDTGASVASAPPLWVIIACGILDWAYVVWWAGFMVLAYKRFRPVGSIDHQTVSA